MVVDRDVHKINDFQMPYGLYEMQKLLFVAIRSVSFRGRTGLFENGISWNPVVVNGLEYFIFNVCFIRLTFSPTGQKFRETSF